MNANIYNIAIIIGLCLIGMGFYQIHPPTALIVVGFIIIALSVFSVFATRGK